MARLIMWNLMTLDGFFEGKAGFADLDWHNEVWGEDLEKLSKDVGRTAGALMFGRKTYDQMSNYWPGEKGEIADFMNGLPKLVFSRALKTSDWTNTQFFDDASPAMIERLKRETPKDIFIFGSADLSASLMPHGLIDEFRICMCPIILGGGTPLFKRSEDLSKLTLLDAKPISTGGVILRYQPAK